MNVNKRWTLFSEIKTLIQEDAKSKGIDLKERRIDTIGDYIMDQKNNFSMIFLESAINTLSSQEELSVRYQEIIDNFKERIEELITIGTKGEVEDETSVL